MKMFIKAISTLSVALFAIIAPEKANATTVCDETTQISITDGNDKAAFQPSILVVDKRIEIARTGGRCPPCSRCEIPPEKD